MPTTPTRNDSAARTPNAWDAKEIGCSWKREKKGTNEKYLTGTLNLKNIPGFPNQDIPFVAFSNKHKSKDTHPDLRIYISEKRPAADAPAPRASAPAPAARPAAARPTARPAAPAPVESEDPDANALI